MIQYFISENTNELSDEQKEVFRAFHPNQVVPISVVCDRQLVRGITTPETLVSAVAYLTEIGKEPRIIRVLNQDGTDFGVTKETTNENGEATTTYDGTAVYSPNMAEYQAFFPEETYQDEEGNTVTYKRPENTGDGWVL